MSISTAALISFEMVLHSTFIPSIPSIHTTVFNLCWHTDFSLSLSKIAPVEEKLKRKHFYVYPHQFTLYIFPICHPWKCCFSITHRRVAHLVSFAITAHESLFFPLLVLCSHFNKQWQRTKPISGIVEISLLRNVGLNRRRPDSGNLLMAALDFLELSKFGIENRVIKSLHILRHFR